MHIAIYKCDVCEENKEEEDLPAFRIALIQEFRDSRNIQKKSKDWLQKPITAKLIETTPGQIEKHQ